MAYPPERPVRNHQPRVTMTTVDDLREPCSANSVAAGIAHMIADTLDHAAIVNFPQLDRLACPLIRGMAPR